MLYEHKVELVNIHISKMRVIKSKRFKYLEFFDGIFIYYWILSTVKNYVLLQNFLRKHMGYIKLPTLSGGLLYLFINLLIDNIAHITLPE